MSALPSVSLDASTLARLGVLHGTEALLPSRAVLGLDWPELEKALPDGGLPRGVIELAAMPRMSGFSRGISHAFESMRGGTTTIAIAAVRAVHAADENAWCVWCAPDHAPSLYAPALAQAGVDLDRLLVVRAPAPALSRTVVKAASSGAFGLVVVDLPRGTVQDRDRKSVSTGLGSERGMGRSPMVGNEGVVVTRKLALAAEEYGTTSLLLTSALTPRSVPWPVTMRLEVERRPDSLAVRVAKDRRGPGTSHHVVRLAS